MAITQCRECGGNVSTEAPTCPRCGAPYPAGSRGTHRAQQERNAGCGQMGCFLLVVIFLMAALSGMCDGSGGSRTGSYAPAGSAYSASGSTSSYNSSSSYAAGGADTFYVHGALNVRSGPGSGYGVVRTLRRGERIVVGPRDGDGWAKLESGYGQEYVYRASDLVRSSPPRARTSAPRLYSSPDEVNPSGATARCRDGALSYSAHRSGTCSHHGGVAVWY